MVTAGLEKSIALPMLTNRGDLIILDLQCEFIRKWVNSLKNVHRMAEMCVHYRAPNPTQTSNTDL